MNERIFELAKQADLIQWDSLPSGARTPDHESVVKAQKFAELIVRECASKVDWIYAEKGITIDGVNFTVTQGDLIKQHFGVEE